MSAENEKRPMENPPPYGFQEPGVPQGPPPVYHHGATIIQQPTHANAAVIIPVRISMGLGSTSQRINCPHCNADISTSVKYTESTKTHIIALLLCLIGCWPCCLIPYCLDDCKDAEHDCPNCQRHIGRFRR